VGRGLLVSFDLERREGETMSGFRVPKKLLCGALGAVLCAAVCAAYGDAAEGSGSEASRDSSADALAEVVVTAQKREEKLQDVGVTVAAVSGQQLQNAGVRDIKDLGNVVSGFHVSTSYDGLPEYSIRGLGFTSNQIAASPTVSVYVDEAPMPYLVMTGDTTLDLERVEVLKGPNAMIFGRGGGGVVLNISSMAGYMSATPYAVSKLTVRGLTVAFATELAPDRIRVNAIAPGLMNTENALADLPKPLIDEFTHRLQLVHRLGTMDDVVSAMLFLCSDEASFVTGETLKVSGGYPLNF